MAKLKNKRENHQTKRSIGGNGRHNSANYGAYGESAGSKGLKDKPTYRQDRQDRQSQKRNFDYGYDDETTQNANIIVGRNPVIEALKNNREIDKLLVSAEDGSMIKILAMARDNGIPVMKVEKSAIDRIARGKAHQGVLAYISPYEYSELADIFSLAEERGEDPFIIILDNLEDPHNLGAIMRTAECVGAHGVIIPKRRACGLTETVAKASAGAIEYIPCVKVTNIAQTVEELQKMGIWVACCDMGGKNYYNADLKGKIAVVIGSEGFGVSELVRKKCDFVVSMPMVGKITSLNASNAGAVIMYEIRKQRDGNK